MADAIVPQPRREEAIPLRDEPGIGPGLAFPDRLPWARIVLWAALTALLVGFLALGTVRVSAGNWNGRRMRVSLIWERFLEFLAGQGFPAPTIAGLLLAVVIALAGSAYLLWLAFGLHDADAGEMQEPSPR